MNDKEKKCPKCGFEANNFSICPECCDVGMVDKDTESPAHSCQAESDLLDAEQQQRLIEAVRFYAETAKYNSTWKSGDADHVMEDNGAIAKIALRLAGI